MVLGLRVSALAPTAVVATGEAAAPVRTSEAATRRPGEASSLQRRLNTGREEGSSRQQLSMIVLTAGGQLSGRFSR